MLQAALKAEFQSRLAAHEKEIDQLENEVKKLRQQLELRRRNQDEIVHFRMEQLLRDAQGLGWGTEPVRTSAARRTRFLYEIPSRSSAAGPRTEWWDTGSGSVPATGAVPEKPAVNPTSGENTNVQDRDPRKPVVSVNGPGAGIPGAGGTTGTVSPGIGNPPSSIPTGGSAEKIPRDKQSGEGGVSKP